MPHCARAQGHAESTRLDSRAQSSDRTKNQRMARLGTTTYLATGPDI